MLNFTLDPNGKNYVSEDPKKLSQRVINTVKVLIKKKVEEMPLKDALKSSDKLPAIIQDGIKDSLEINSLGLEVLGFLHRLKKSASLEVYILYPVLQCAYGSKNA